MAERIVKEESLTTVADAIRAKGGTTDPLSFPTGFADAISAIQAGGGGKVYFGSFTPEENTHTCRINCDMTTDGSDQLIYPKFAIICDSDVSSISDSGNTNKQVCGCGIQIYTDDVNISAIYSYKGKTTASWGVHDVETQCAAKAANGFLFFYANEKLNTSNKGYIAGRTYHYFASF